MSKKLIGSIVMAAVFLIPAVHAQESGEAAAPAAGPSPDRIVGLMQQKLELTPEEVAAVTPIVADFQTKRQQIKSGVADKKSMRKQMKQLKDEEEEKLSKVLPEEKMKKWQGMQDNLRDKLKERHKEKAGDETQE